MKDIKKEHESIGGQVIPGEYLTASGSVYVVKQGKDGFDVFKQGNPEPIVLGTKKAHISITGQLVVYVEGGLIDANGETYMVTNYIKKFPDGYKNLSPNERTSADFVRLTSQIDELREIADTLKGASQQEISRCVQRLSMIDDAFYSLPGASTDDHSKKAFELQNKIQALRTKLRPMVESLQGEDGNAVKMPQSNLMKLASEEGIPSELIEAIAGLENKRLDKLDKKPGGLKPDGKPKDSK